MKWLSWSWCVSFSPSFHWGKSCPIFHFGNSLDHWEDPTVPGKPQYWVQVPEQKPSHDSVLPFFNLHPPPRPAPLQMFGQYGHYLDLRFFPFHCRDLYGLFWALRMPGSRSCWLKPSQTCEQQKCQEISPLSRRKPVQAGLATVALISSSTELVSFWITSWDNRHACCS